jgi:hypothetical protein
MHRQRVLAMRDAMQMTQLDAALLERANQSAIESSRLK